MPLHPVSQYTNPVKHRWQVNLVNQRAELIREAVQPTLVKLLFQKRRSLKLKVNDSGQAELRLPKGVAVSDIRLFLAKHTSWLEQQLLHWQENQQRSLRFVPILGQQYTIRYLEPSAAIASTKIKPRSQALGHLDSFNQTCWLAVEVDAQSSEDMTTAAINSEQDQIWRPANINFHAQVDQVCQLLRPLANDIFQQRINFWWPIYQQITGDHLTTKPVLRIKRMKTRWGSLSRRGYINLNLSLIHYPQSALDMVIVHELSHCQHFHHGPEFYQLMSHIKPDWPQDEILLKDPKYRFL